MYSSRSTMTDLIEAGKELKMSSNYLHFKEVVTNSKGEKFIVLINAIFERYYDLMLDNASTVELSDTDYFKYRFKPKVLSTDLYGTPELHFLLLRLNNMVSISQFDVKTLRVFNPKVVNILNEIMIHEYDNFVNNDVEVIKKMNE